MGSGKSGVASAKQSSSADLKSKWHGRDAAQGSKADLLPSLAARGVRSSEH